MHIISKEAFFDLIFGYKLEVAPNDELDIAKNEMEKIKEAIFKPNAWAGATVFFVTGCREE